MADLIRVLRTKTPALYEFTEEELATFVAVGKKLSDAISTFNGNNGYAVSVGSAGEVTVFEDEELDLFFDDMDELVTYYSNQYSAINAKEDRSIKQ